MQFFLPHSVVIVMSIRRQSYMENDVVNLLYSRIPKRQSYIVFVRRIATSITFVYVCVCICIQGGPDKVRPTYIFDVNI